MSDFQLFQTFQGSVETRPTLRRLFNEILAGISSAVHDDTESLLEELREDIYNYMDEYGRGPR